MIVRLCFCFMVLMPWMLVAQKSTYQWVMGNGAGLDFSSGPVTKFSTSKSVAKESCCSSIASSSGALLFYTDGYKLYDASGGAIKTLSHHTALGPIATRIVKIPGKESYKIFYVGFHDFSLRVLDVDVSPSGKLTVGTITQPLPGVFVEPKIAFARHHKVGKKEGFWIVLRVHNASSRTRQFLALPFGVSSVFGGVYSSSGSLTSGLLNTASAQGFMKISPKGDQLVITHKAGVSSQYGFLTELFDFDSETGKITNAQVISTWSDPAKKIEFPNGVSFSPDGNLLYVADEWLHNKSGIYQYNLNAPDIAASKVLLVNLSSSTGRFQLGDFSMTHEGRIYFAQPGQKILGEIIFPNKVGFDCLASANKIALTENSGGMLPQFDYSGLDFQITVKEDCTSSGLSSVTLSYSGDRSLVKEVSWKTAGSDRKGFSISYNLPPKISLPVSVKVTSKLGLMYVRTLTITPKGKPSFSLGSDVMLPCGTSKILKVQSGSGLLPGDVFLWKGGSTASELKVTTPGKYWLKVIRLGGCSFSDTVAVRPAPVKTALGSSASFCDGEGRFVRDAETLLPETPAPVPVSYFWETKSGTKVNSPKVDMKFKNDDAVFLKMDYGYCSIKDTVKISIKPRMNLDLGADVSVCPGVSEVMRHYDFSVQPKALGSVSIRWSDGDTRPKRSFTFKKSQKISVEGRSSHCTLSEDLTVDFIKGIRVDLGSDTTLCLGETLVVSASKHLTAAQKKNAKYHWQDGRTTQNYRITKPGKYTVDVDLGTCQIRDVIEVRYRSGFQLKIPAQVTLCSAKDSYEVDVEKMMTPDQKRNADVLWSDGGKQKRRVFTKGGKHRLELTLWQCRYVYSFEIKAPLDRPELFDSKSETLCYDDTYAVNLYDKIPKAYRSTATFVWGDGYTSGKRIFPKNINRKYTVKVMMGGCTFDDAITLRYLAPIDLAEVRDTLVCYDQDRLVMSTENRKDYEYLWSTGAKTSTTDIRKSGTYWVRAFQGKCHRTKHFDVEFYLGPEIRYTTRDRALSISIHGGYPPFSYAIDGKNYQKENTFLDLKVGTHYAWVRDDNGCLFKSSALEVMDLVIPKFFTPNGDGINDVWHIQGLARYRTASLKVYDRYGRLLCTLSAQKDRWDGRVGRRIVSSDTYWYVLELEGFSKSGYFTIIRD